MLPHITRIITSSSLGPTDIYPKYSPSIHVILPLLTHLQQENWVFYRVNGCLKNLEFRNIVWCADLLGVVSSSISLFIGITSYYSQTKQIKLFTCNRTRRIWCCHVVSYRYLWGLSRRPGTIIPFWKITTPGNFYQPSLIKYSAIFPFL